ncbi:MAG TPA: 30S ribosomal protein S2 [Bacteroidales bacterium]|nr:30S ribosomal protein S2 [Bacteroidales bacterium]HPS18001.1 30S ribosomal protein S2 [Bacteroidales bacterium]
MTKVSYNELLDAGVHFGHLRRKWNPNMAPYIFMEKNGIHIIDLNKTAAKIDEAGTAIKQIAKSGKKILFVATKKQAKDIVAEHVKRVNMPFVTERWPGGMLTNFATIRKAVKKMSGIDKMFTDGTSDNMSKKERLQITRERAKLEKNLGSIADLTRLPAALFIVDISKEHIAVAEAKKLSIPTFAIVDTNSNPNEVDFPIPANDDAAKSISLVVNAMVEAIEEGLAERKFDKDKQIEDEREEAFEAAELKSKTIVELEAQEDEEEVKKTKKAAAKQVLKAKDTVDTEPIERKDKKFIPRGPKPQLSVKKPGIGKKPIK